MPFELDIRHENLSYVGRFAYPLFELWGSGGVILKGLYGALASYGVTLQNVQVHGNVQSASEPVVTVQVPKFGALKFSFERIEFSFEDFTVEFFESIPALLNAAVLWIVKAVPGFKFVSHQFTYFTHAFVKDSTPEQVLRGVNIRELKSAGISLGNGAIFNFSVPQKNWETQLIMDRSKHLNGALFVSLAVTVRSGEVEYAKLLEEGRAYFRGILSELELSIPEVEE
jgi:hypothetical protein